MKMKNEKMKMKNEKNEKWKKWKLAIFFSKTKIKRRGLGQKDTSTRVN